VEARSNIHLLRVVLLLLVTLVETIMEAQLVELRLILSQEYLIMTQLSKGQVLEAPKA